MSPNRDSRLPNFSADTSSTTQASPRPLTKRARFRRRAGRLLQGCLLVGIGTYYAANLTASWQLHNALSAAEERGEPLQFSKVVPPFIPESRNAAPVYLHAADALVLTNTEGEELRVSSGTQVNADLLAKNQAAIELARQAAALPECRFPLHYDAENLAGILLPHLAKVRRLAEIVSAQAQSEARAGQTDAALDDVAVIFRMSEHLTPEPILISCMTAIAIERLGDTTLAHVLQNVTLSPAQAHAFSRRLSHTDWTAVLRQDLKGERCFGLWAFQYVSNPLQASTLANGTGEPTNNPISKLLSVLWSPFWKMDEVHYLQAMDQRSELLQVPGASLESDEIFMRDLPWYAICTRIMLPSLPAVGKKRDQVVDYQRMALAALAIHAYRATTGHYPTDLHEAEAAWGSALPRDLYTNQPFVYKAAGETM
ncbi:MAG: hypothetical protein JWN14_4872, partial [Chthonomonadales bacterium]|nr:hypothetical protein [Chthonomonadales bacterium]